MNILKVLTKPFSVHFGLKIIELIHLNVKCYMYEYILLGHLGNILHVEHV